MPSSFTTEEEALIRLVQQFGLAITETGWAINFEDASNLKQAGTAWYRVGTRLVAFMRASQ